MTLLMVFAKAVIGMSGRTGTGRPAPASRFDERAAQATMITRLSRTAASDRSRVGVAELLAELPRPRAPGDERQQRDRDRPPHERMAEEARHGARCQTTASSVEVATDQPAGGPGSGTKPVTDWTVIGSIASMRSGRARGQVDRRLDDREVGARFGRRGQVDGRVAGVDPEARSGRPGSRVRASGAGSRGRPGPSRRSGSPAWPPGRAPRHPSRCPRRLWSRRSRQLPRPPSRPAG